MNASQSLLLHLEIVRDVGFELPARCTILDFGCGSGRTVQELRSLGHEAFGCDLEFKHDEQTDTEQLKNKGFIRLIDKKRYVLPFEDKTFDLILSDQVLEHVQNYPESIREMARVLKPDGMAFHVFPSRYMPVEPHTYVPLASMIQSYWWLYCWAVFGIRNEFQQHESAARTASINTEYLKNHTNYLSKRLIAAAFSSSFNHVVFCERAFLQRAPRGRYLYTLSRLIPFLPSIYSALRCRVVFAKYPR